jgi:hypothetical protein
MGSAVTIFVLWLSAMWCFSSGFVMRNVMRIMRVLIFVSNVFYIYAVLSATIVYKYEDLIMVN